MHRHLLLHLSLKSVFMDKLPIAPVKAAPAAQDKDGAQGAGLGATLKAPAFSLEASSANPQAAQQPAEAERPQLSDDFSYNDPEFNKGLAYFTKKWSLTAVEPTEDGKDAKKIGDSAGQDPDGTPIWVKQVTRRLIDTPPNAPGLDGVNVYKGQGETWNEDHTLAQKLVAAYYRDWYIHAATVDEGETNMAMDVPSNIDELMQRVGSSKNNKRAQIIGETPGAYYGWCGPASQFAISLGLLKKGFRFKTGKGPTMPTKRVPAVIPQLTKKDPEPYKGYNKRADELAEMQEKSIANSEKMKKFDIADAVRLEVAKQGAFFLANWATKSQKPEQSATPAAGPGYGKNKPAPQKGKARTVTGKTAHTAPLESGDHISIITGSSPLSGHVATVIKEETVAPVKPTGYEPGDTISRIYYISGNSKGSAVRVEVVQRELPPESYSWDAVAGKGNKFSDLKQAEKLAMDKANKSVGGNIQGALMVKLFSKPDMRKEATKLAKGGGFMQYIPANWSKKEIILPFFTLAGMDPAKYLESLTNPEMAKVEEARAAKDDYKAEQATAGIPVDHQDPNFGSLNKQTRPDGKEIGKIKPLDKDHGWVVSIVKSSLLDANRIESEINMAVSGNEDQGLDAETKLTTEVLDKYGLEKVPAEWMSMYQEGLNYWETEGGFKQ